MSSGEPQEMDGGQDGGQDGDQDAAQGRTGEKLDRLLSAAAGLMARQGYGQTTIRDVARETGFSLAGMYYYFKNKEDLLFQIQHRTFAAVLAEQERVAAEDRDPVEKLRGLVRNHLSHFVDNFAELKVCTFELQSLQDERYGEIEGLRRRYYQSVAKVVGEILASRGRPLGARTLRHYTLFVFGMLNWIFMWYDPARDEPLEDLGREMVSLILHGLDGAPDG
jgi:AcrR family transcriptional regulator